jgi:serine-type D-Ala-D-Ala carboxypeptidase/endopeptidase
MLRRFGSFHCALACVLLACGGSSDSRDEDSPSARVDDDASMPPEDVEAAVHALVDPLMADGWIPGLAVALVDHDDVRFLGFGTAGPDGRAVDPDTVFEIGSITKLFTGIALAAMAERGDVALDEPVGALLPSGTQLPAAGGDAITLLDLATHHSGLPVMPDNLMPADPDNPYADYGPEQLYAYLAAATLERAPGTGFEYSNLGFGLLGHALALRSEQDYADLLDSEIFGPLAMTDTSIQVPESARDRVAAGHDADGQPRPAWDFDVLAPAGAVHSTLRDMSGFASAALGALDTPLRAQLDLALAPHRDLPEGEIGLGWLITPAEGHWHNGQTGGFHSLIGLDRERQVAVVALASGAAPVVDSLAFALLEVARGAQPMPLSVPETVELPPESLDAYVGSYSLTAELTLEVSRDGDALRGQITDQPSFRLWPSGEDEFYLRVVPALISFTRAESGEVEALALLQGDQFVVAPRL